MDPIQVELVGYGSVPWDSIVPAATAILVALVSGFIGYKWQGRNLAVQIEAQSVEARRDRVIRVRELTLIPFRDLASEIQVAALELVAKAQTSGNLTEARSRYVNAISEFGPYATKLSSIELHNAGYQFQSMMNGIIREYLASDGSPHAVVELVERWDAAGNQIVEASTHLQLMVEMMLQGEDID